MFPVTGRAPQIKSIAERELILMAFQCECEAHLFMAYWSILFLMYFLKF